MLFEHKAMHVCHNAGLYETYPIELKHCLCTLHQ